MQNDKFIEGTVMKGKDLKGYTLCKILSEDMKLRGFQYKIGMNEYVKPNILGGDYREGFRFYLIEDICRYLSHGTKLAMVSVPDEEDVGIRMNGTLPTKWIWYKGKKAGCRVRLCGQGKQGDGAGKKALLPVAAVRAQDILDVVLIDTGNVVQKGTERRLVLEKMDDIRLVRGGDLGIRDNEGGEECVCPVAFTAAEAADAQTDETVRGLQATPVTAVDRKAGGMPA